MIEILFLGGIDVGASCTALRFGDEWLVVDAGVRMSGEAAQRLPDLAALDDKPVAAILVTHAHADHIGALPLLHQKYPDAPIYATSATIRLMTIMLADALAVMAKRATEELELPLYDAEVVERMLRRLVPLPVDTRIPLPDIADLTVSLRLAGHIAGAVSVGLEHPQGHIVFSGDLSIADQRTVAGAQLPLVTEPDLLIMESTYGGRQHAQRAQEEQRLAAEVAAAIQRGGHVLIPAFALGRAQEVILILQEAQRRREIVQFTVWVDGLVRRVCAAYTTVPAFLRPAIRQRIVRGQPVFFNDTIRMVEHPGQRTGILQGQPACIIASSGMLTGGPSAWFAAQLLPRPEATIAITGYQDEEAPGRALQDAAAGRRTTLTLGQRTMGLAANVTTYSLSGHADEHELVAWAQQIRPRQVALVHGDGGARQSVAAALQAAGLVTILPQVGVPLRISGATHGQTYARPVTSLLPQRTRQEAPDSPEALAQVLWATAERPVEPIMVEVHEAARTWYGVEGTPEEVQAIATLFAAAAQRFQPLGALPGFFRMLPPATLRQSAPVAVPFLRDGSLVLARINGSAVVPWFCQRLVNDVLTGIGPSRQRANQPVRLRDVVAWVGQWDVPATATPEAQQRVMDDWLAQGSTQRSHVSARVLAEALRPAQTYDLDGLLLAIERPVTDLPWRLHLAQVVVAHPRIFQLTPAPQPQQDARWSVRLAPSWEIALEHGTGQPRPDTHAIQARIDWYFRDIKELYRRSIDSDTGNVTLRFRFPLTAEQRFAGQLAALRAELPGRVEIGGTTDQMAILNLIQLHLRPVLKIAGTPVVVMAERHVAVRYHALTAEDLLPAALAAIAERSGFQVTCVPLDSPEARHDPLTIGAPAPERLGRDEAVAAARDLLTGVSSDITGDKGTGTLFVRLPLPYGDMRRYGARLAEVVAATGWGVRVRPHAQHTALEAAVRAALPPEAELLLPLSVSNQKQLITGQYRGSPDLAAMADAEAEFARVEGWQLTLRPAE